MTFREQVLERIKLLLGEPAALRAEPGDMYRWTVLRRARRQLAVYITLASPELPDYAHLIISDPSAARGEQVVTFIMRTPEEVDRALDVLRRRLDCE